MPYTSFVNCAETVVGMRLASQEVLMTFGVRKGSALDIADLDTINGIFVDWINTDFAPIVCDDLSFEYVKTTNLLTDSSPVRIRTSGLPATGGVVGIPVPNNVAGVVSLATENRGRSYRGRNYVPGISTGNLLTTSTWTAAFAATMGTVWEDLAALLAADGFDHVVLSRVQGGVTLTVGVATRVTTYTGRQVVGTQRRRVQGVGV